MRHVRRHEVRRPRAALIVTAVALGLIALTGGSSRYDIPALIVLRPALVLAAGVLVLLPRGNATAARVPLILLSLLATAIALQLVPLPPMVWEVLPRRVRYLDAAVIAHAAQPWRPISIVPTLTLNSLLALLPAVVMLVGFDRIDHRRQRLVLSALLIVALLSAMIGVLQLGTPNGGWAYFYAFMTDGLPAGLFANRNHQAAFLAGSLPMFACWALITDKPITTRRRETLPSVIRFAAAGVGAALVALIVLASGSRTGLLLLLLNVVGAIYLIVTIGSIDQSRRRLSIALGIAGAALLIVAMAVSFGRGSGFARFEALEQGTEMRLAAWPILERLTMDYLPWGSGFGTFDPLFRMYEPDALLQPSYFNQAHNDLLELVLTGGVPALLVLLAGLGWFGWRIARVFRGAARANPDMVAAQAGAMMLATFLLASLSDYPLRTPLAGALAALAAGLLERGVTGLREKTPALVDFRSDG